MILNEILISIIIIFITISVNSHGDDYYNVIIYYFKNNIIVSYYCKINQYERDGVDNIYIFTNAKAL